MMSCADDAGTHSIIAEIEDLELSFVSIYNDTGIHQIDSIGVT
jgi:hypothetical protein